MTTKYRVVVEVLSLKTLDVEVNASNPEDAKKAVTSAISDYGVSDEALLMIQTHEDHRGFSFRLGVVSEAMNVKETTLAPSEHDIEFEPWFLELIGQV